MYYYIVWKLATNLQPYLHLRKTECSATIEQQTHRTNSNLLCFGTNCWLLHKVTMCVIKVWCYLLTVATELTIFFCVMT